MGGCEHPIIFCNFFKNVLQIWRHGPVYTVRITSSTYEVVLVHMKCDVYMVESSIMIGG